MRKSTKQIALTVGVATALVLGVGAGTAVGLAPMFFAPRGVTSDVEAAPMPEPSWQTNEVGQTYGSMLDARYPDEAPELIQATATNGIEGYVKRVELYDADGTTASMSFKDPSEAIAWQNTIGQVDQLIPVYAEDGRTVVGEFLISGAESMKADLAEVPLPLP